MLFETVPAIDGDLVVPPVSEFRTPAILRFKFHGRNFFPGVFLVIPDDTDAV